MEASMPPAMDFEDPSLNMPGGAGPADAPAVDAPAADAAGSDNDALKAMQEALEREGKKE
jgi:hypothetical protein